MFMLFHVYVCFALMYICAQHVCLVLEEVRRHWTWLNWSYRWVVSHHEGAWNWNLVVCKSKECSQPRNHLSNPFVRLSTGYNPILFISMLTNPDLTSGHSLMMASVSEWPLHCLLALKSVPDSPCSFHGSNHFFDKPGPFKRRMIFRSFCLEAGIC